jgi:hypothetical protein
MVDGWWWNDREFVRTDPQDHTMSLETLREISALAGYRLCTTAERADLDKRIAKAARLKVTSRCYRVWCTASNTCRDCEAELARLGMDDS